MLGNQVLAQVDSSYYTVRLSSFDASLNRKIVQLRFRTVCFLDFANFQIQKSANGIDYTTVNSFTADRLRCQQPFEFNDTANLWYGNIFYRINVGNIDGIFYNSQVRKLSFKNEGVARLKVFPTVVSSSLNFTISNDEAETITAAIINQSGVVVRQQKFDSVRGISNYNVGTSNLPGGFYFLQVANTEGEKSIAKFLKQ